VAQQAIEKRELDQEDLLGLGVGGESSSPPKSNPTSNPLTQSQGHSDNLLDIGIGDEIVSSPVHSNPPNQGFGMLDLMGGSSSGPGSMGGSSGSRPGQGQWKNPTLEQVLTRMQPGMSGKQGLDVFAAVVRAGTGLQLQLTFKSGLPAVLGIAQITTMPNPLGITVMYQPGSCMIPAQGSQDVTLQINRQHGMGLSYTSIINLNVSTNYDNYVLGVPVYPHLLADLTKPVTTEEFKQGWMSGQTFQVDHPTIPPLLNQEEALKTLFRNNGITHLSTQSPGGVSKLVLPLEKYYFGCRLDTQEVALAEITSPSPNMIGACQVVVKSGSMALPKAFAHSLFVLLR